MLRSVTKIPSVAWFCLSFISLHSVPPTFKCYPHFHTWFDQLRYEAIENAPENASQLVGLIFFAMGIYKVCCSVHAVNLARKHLAEERVIEDALEREEHRLSYPTHSAPSPGTPSPSAVTRIRPQVR